jgi:hypothetical protein
VEVEFKFSSEDVPDTVKIGILSKKFKPAVMPHRAIVDSLAGYITRSKIAAHFHGDKNVLCQGCHHHGAIGLKPALCENCHGKPFNEHALFKPGLKGAFHGQCVGCHEVMHIKETSDCTLCHKRNPSSTGTAGNELHGQGSEK